MPHEDIPFAPNCPNHVAKTAPPSLPSKFSPRSPALEQTSSSATNVPRTLHHRAVKLMDLSDEVLSQIITAFSPHGMRRRFIVFGPPTFPLALTCTRLFRLFRNHALHDVDAIFPETYARVPTRVPDGQVQERMIVSLIRLAGSTLRSLHFCRDMPGLNLALDEIASHRLRLRELSYSRGTEPVDEDKEHAMFRHMGDLHKLSVNDPRGALRFMHLAPNLEELELTGVRPNAFFDLFSALRQVGPSLRKLLISFRATESLSLTSASYAGVATPIWCVGSFATHVSSRLAIDLPNLEILDVSASFCHTIWHQSRIDEYNLSITSAVVQLGERIRSFRERNALLKLSTKLKRLAIRATFGDANKLAFKCVHLFRSMITPEIDVEIQAAGMTVVFPANNSPPQFKSLQITLQDLEELLDLDHIDCTRIKAIDVGTNILSTAYAEHESIREKALNLVWESTKELTEVHGEINVDCISTMKNLSNYIADILEISPNVSTVVLRTSVIFFCGQGLESFGRLLDMMEDIRILRLTTHEEYSSDRMLTFVKNLPLFLHLITKACPKLECLHLEYSMPVLVVAFAPPEEREVERQLYSKCEDAVRASEAALPACDFTSVRSQLILWQHRLNPNDWSLPF